MLTHQDIWRALDTLAEKFAMSPSAMARQAGLDPTTFNKSKRMGADGKARWPSTESLSKVLNALGVSFEDFASGVAQNKAGRLGMAMGANIPLINLSQAGHEGLFDEIGYPIGEDWDEIRIPGMRDDHLFSLQISGDSLLPILRDGDRVVVSPGGNIRQGDRVVVKTRSGEVLIKTFGTMRATKVSLEALNPVHPKRDLPLNDIQWMARIVWVSQ